MVPDYLIIDEQRRREQEDTAIQRLPLHPPLPPFDILPDDTKPTEYDISETVERGVYIIDMNTFETTRL